MLYGELGYAYAVICHNHSEDGTVYPVSVYAGVDSADNACMVLGTDPVALRGLLRYRVWEFPWALGDPQTWLDLLREVASGSTGTLRTVHLVLAYGLVQQGRFCEPMPERLQPLAACLDLDTAYSVGDQFQDEQERKVGRRLPQLYEVWNAPLRLGSVADWTGLRRTITRIVSEREGTQSQGFQ